MTTNNPINAPFPFTIVQGGTNSSGYTASNSGNNAIPYYNGSTTTNGIFQTGGDFLYNTTQGLLQINTSATFPGLTITTTSTSANIAYLSLTRAASSNGNSQIRLMSALTIDWYFGTFSGSQDLVFSAADTTNVLQLSFGTNDVTINSGNLIFGTATKGLEFKHVNVSGGTANSILVLGVVASGGSITVNNSAITGNHIGIPILVTSSGTLGNPIVTCNNGSFTLTTGALDGSDYTILFIKGIP